MINTYYRAIIGFRVLRASRCVVGRGGLLKMYRVVELQAGFRALCVRQRRQL